MPRNYTLFVKARVAHILFHLNLIGVEVFCHMWGFLFETEAKELLSKSE